MNFNFTTRKWLLSPVKINNALRRYSFSCKYVLDCTIRKNTNNQAYNDTLCVINTLWTGNLTNSAISASVIDEV